MRIVIIDTGAVAGDLLTAVLGDAGHETVVVREGAQGVHEATSRPTDVVLLRADPPDMDGYRFCMELRARRFSGPVIFVSGESAMRTKVQAFDHGADDYIVEPYDSRELIARVHAVARRCEPNETPTPGDVLTVGNVELSLATLTVRVGSQAPVLLTPIEMRILECLMRNAEITISRETLIERTWGYDFIGESNRLDVNILRLRKKLEDDPARPHFLQTVRGIGYVVRAVPRSDPTAPPRLFTQEDCDTTALATTS